MNYRTMVKGALAFSLSLIVGTAWATDTQTYGVTFEPLVGAATVENDHNYTNNMSITDATLRDEVTGTGWFAAADDESKIIERIAEGSTQALQLNTESNTLTNKFASDVANAVNNTIGGLNDVTKGTAFFETEVKFVASDTLDAGIAGGTDATKFAIYAYCDDQAETVTTNLVVFHAYYDANDEIAYTNEVFDTLIDCEVYTKLRVEMKKMQNPSLRDVNVFSVKVGNAEPLSSDTSLDAKMDDELVKGIWFLTTEEQEDDNNKLVTSLNFKGTGEIDNIKVGTIANDVPDANWTLEGFNSGNNRWPLPTAVAADSKTLFYSNLVVNIDPVGDGRTIPAAWVGAKVTASEAAAADLSAWNFEYDAQDGTRKTYAFNAAKDGEDYLYWWVPITAAEVRTAIANQSDIVKTMVVYTSSTSGADAQTLTVSICPKNIEITNTDDVENGETIDVDDWIEQGVVTATVISVAKLSATGAMVGDAAPTLTATVTDENGDAVAAADYTIDASAIDMTTAGLYPVIITATGAGYAGTLTNYYAVMNLTWFNGTPTQKALINPQNMTLTGAHYMHTTQDGAYLAIAASNGNGTGWGHALYSVATLTSIYGTCQGVWEVAHFTNGGGKGMTANTTSGIMLNGGGSVGGTVATQSTFKGYDIGDLANIGTSSNMVQETYTAEWDGSGYAAGQIMDGIDFNHAGTKVFGNNAGTDGPWVYQLAIDKAAKTMTWEATYTTDLGRVRSVSAYYIDGKDYVFVGEGASSGKGEIAVIDPSDGSITTICVAADDFTTAEFPASRYFTNVKVSGIASGEMYLYGCTDKGEVVVWALGHDAVTGEWKTAPVGNITSAQTAALNSKASVGNCRAFEVSDDNNAGFLYVQSSPGQFAVVTDISLAQRKALASATLTPAGSDKDVALGAITATVLDEDGATVAASEYTITTNLIDIATAGEYTVTITPVEGSVYSNAVTAVYTISEPAPAQKPAWAADSGDGSDQDPYWAWATAHAAGQDLYAEGADYSAQYLMNVDADKTPVLKIDSIQVGPGAAVIIVSATDGTDPISLATINGVLNVAVGSSVTALTPKALGRAPTVSQDGRAMVVISTEDGSFYRARVDFAAAETALTPVVISGGE